MNEAGKIIRRSRTRPSAVIAEEYLTAEQLAQRLGWESKTIRNKMGTVFKKGIHYAEAPGLPVLFKWSAVLELYTWETPHAQPSDNGIKNIVTSIPMSRGYTMK